jgi:hypothetical protein
MLAPVYVEMALRVLRRLQPDAKRGMGRRFVGQAIEWLSRSDAPADLTRLAAARNEQVKTEKLKADYWHHAAACTANGKRPPNPPGKDRQPKNQLGLSYHSIADPGVPFKLPPPQKRPRKRSNTRANEQQPAPAPIMIASSAQPHGQAEKDKTVTNAAPAAPAADTLSQPPPSSAMPELPTADPEPAAKRQKTTATEQSKDMETASAAALKSTTGTKASKDEHMASASVPNTPLEPITSTSTTPSTTAASSDKDTEPSFEATIDEPTRSATVDKVPYDAESEKEEGEI